MISIHPYLTFEGNCEEAFLHYQSIFGGEFTFMGRFSEMPPDPKFSIAEEEKNRIMHVSLPIGENSVLMGSDTAGGYAPPVNQGNNFSISINLKDTAEADRVFDALSQGGSVKMPMTNTFWNAYYGMLTDKFGIHWMINCDLAEHKNNQ